MGGISLVKWILDLRIVKWRPSSLRNIEIQTEDQYVTSQDWERQFRHAQIAEGNAQKQLEHKDGLCERLEQENTEMRVQLSSLTTKLQEKDNDLASLVNHLEISHTKQEQLKMEYVAAKEVAQAMEELFSNMREQQEAQDMLMPVSVDQDGRCSDDEGGKACKQTLSSDDKCGANVQSLIREFDRREGVRSFDSISTSTTPPVPYWHRSKSMPSEAAARREKRTSQRATALKTPPGALQWHDANDEHPNANSTCSAEETQVLFENTQSSLDNEPEPEVSQSFMPSRVMHADCSHANDLLCIDEQKSDADSSNVSSTPVFIS